MNEFKYRKIPKHWKYQLTEPYGINLPIKIKGAIHTEFIDLVPDIDPNRSAMVARKYYAWDGASGPAIDTKDFMRGSLVHDCLYQLIREGYLDKSYRKQADKILVDICNEDGMPGWRNRYIYWAVRLFGRLAIIRR